MKLLLIALLAMTPAGAQAQTAPPAAATSATASQSGSTTASAGQLSGQQPSAAPVTEASLDRIKRSLLVLPALEFGQQKPDDKPRFHTTTYGKQPTFQDFLGSFDLRNGPVPHAGMTHQEFVDSVQPKNQAVHTGVADVVKAIGFQAGVLAAQRIILNGIEALRHAKSEAEKTAIRAQIDKELAALAGPIK